MKIHEITKSINNAFFRLESYMKGAMKEYQYYGFNNAFTKLFIEAKKNENFTYKNCKLIGEYWKLTEQIRVDYDKSDFENTDAYKNIFFCDDCDEIVDLNWDRIDEFAEFETSDQKLEYEHKKSITDIINIKSSQTMKSGKSETLKDLITHIESKGIIESNKLNKNSERELSKPSFTFINNFDQVEPDKVYKHFFKSLVEAKYIDESTLKSYLILAFQDMQETQQRITIKNKSTNKKIQEIFYKYYKDIAGKPYGKQLDYVKLLGNYFIGFDTENLKTNFSKIY